MNITIGVITSNPIPNKLNAEVSMRCRLSLPGWANQITLLSPESQFPRRPTSGRAFAIGKAKINSRAKGFGGKEDKETLLGCGHGLHSNVV
jgi:hypothetical protein